jgi:hypothetical protein
MEFAVGGTGWYAKNLIVDHGSRTMNHDELTLEEQGDGLANGWYLRTSSSCQSVSYRKQHLARARQV